jgi:hypothetical protein
MKVLYSNQNEMLQGILLVLFMLEVIKCSGPSDAGFTQSGALYIPKCLPRDDAQTYLAIQHPQQRIRLHHGFSVFPDLSISVTHLVAVLASTT